MSVPRITQAGEFFSAVVSPLRNAPSQLICVGFTADQRIIGRVYKRQQRRLGNAEHVIRRGDIGASDLSAAEREHAAACLGPEARPRALWT